MTWAKLDDRFPNHPKVSELSDAAFRLHVTAICYASQYETDGLLPPNFAKGRRVSELVRAGLWEAVESGRYQVHDYLDWNPSHADLDALRTASRERQSRFRQRVSNGVTDGVTNAENDALLTGLPTRPDLKNPPLPPPTARTAPREGARAAPGRWRREEPARAPQPPPYEPPDGEPMTDADREAAAEKLREARTRISARKP